MQKLRDLYVLVALVTAALVVGIGIVGFEIPEGGGRRELLLAGGLAAGAAVYFLLKPKK